jgi:hypothetical protein
MKKILSALLIFVMAVSTSGTSYANEILDAKLVDSQEFVELSIEKKLDLLNSMDSKQISEDYECYLELVRSIEDDLNLDEGARYKEYSDDNFETYYKLESKINDKSNDPVSLINGSAGTKTYYYDMGDYFNSYSKIVRSGVLSFSLDPKAATKTWRSTADEGFVAFKQNYYGDPDLTNIGGLEDQYVCHFYFAKFKTPWNIEPSRPNVSYSATVTAKCNP